MSRVQVILKRGLFLVGAVLVFAGLYAISQVDYLLFHSLVELFSVAVALAIFMVAWNTRGMVDAGFVLVLGVAFLFVGAIDTLHTLAYHGMGVFRGEPGSNLATQLWVAARFVQSASLFLAFLVPARRLRAWPLMAAYAAVFSLVLLSIFAWRVFPVCFDEGNMQRDDSVDALCEILARNRAGLSEVEQTIVVERFAIGTGGKGRTLSEVGKLVGLTNERVRQIQNTALAKIRAALDEGFLVA